MKKFFLIFLVSSSLFGGERFQISGDLIKDFRTDLMWQRESSSNTMNWKSAIQYCENLSLGGYRDWRLPHIDELKSIVNYNAYKPATFNRFKLKTTDWHWAITKYNNSSSWIVNFNGGDDGWDRQADDSFAVCVRDL
ncbi:Protein of unknown function (DUF1566) [Thiovulum sp. ES]|nr:Protein of unknown function (DUF1566) [Thiovulum sp. ES]